jgi:type I restriction enzyme M protein
METRTLRTLSDDDTARIAGTYHAWRNKNSDPGYQDVPGFAKAASVDDIATHDFVLSPGRYVGMAETEDDGEPIDEKIARLTEELYAEFARGAELEKVIRERLAGLSDG